MLLILRALSIGAGRLIFQQAKKEKKSLCGKSIDQPLMFRVSTVWQQRPAPDPRWIFCCIRSECVFLCKGFGGWFAKRARVWGGLYIPLLLNYVEALEVLSVLFQIFLGRYFGCLCAEHLGVSERLYLLCKAWASAFKLWRLDVAIKSLNMGLSESSCKNTKSFG